jgi:peptidyl-prolyl cis-trans isomerase-like 4
VLSKINNAYCDDNGRPYQNIRIRHTVILDDPFDDIEGMIIPSKSPEPIYDNSDCTRLEDDFDINEFYKDKQTEDELKQKLREQDAKNKAIILELLEDIPDSEIKPPENVLFVCKLNPITQDDDLENIFSMYGNIKSCQIIRDRKTGESLKYAFIEYEKVEDCEKAYLKMNGVLIDDRRIKVDFSQSVAKYWYNYNNNNNSKGGDSKGNNNSNSNSNGNSNNNNQGDNENALNLVNENVKLEIKQTKNFNPVKDDKYKFVFSHNSNSGDTYKGYNNYNKHKYHHHHQQGYYKSNYNHNHYYNNNNDYYNSNNYKHYSSHYHNTKRSRSRTDSSNRSYDSYNYSGSKYTNKYKHNNYYHNHKYKDHYYNSYHKYK